MKIYMELYDKEKTYVYPNGEYAAPERVLQKFPAAAELPYIIQTDAKGKMMYSFEPLTQSRSREDIPESLTDEEAVKLIEDRTNDRMNAPALPSAEERIAAAMEFQNLML